MFTGSINKMVYIWVDKKGNKLTFKEFMVRFKSGLEGVTMLQKVALQIWSTIIMLIGILCGIVITLFVFKTAWWLTIILCAALFNTLIQLLSLWQQKRILKRFV